MSTTVVGLGVWCDYVTVDEYRQSLADRALANEHVEPPATGGWMPFPSHITADQIEAEVENFRRGLHFRVEEFAMLSDGRRLVLSNDRGWGGSMSGGRGPDDMWAYETVETIERTALNVVLPDDAEDTGEEHPWELLAERIRAFGVETTPEELKRLPYDVELSQRLRARRTRSG
jgi:hypothetical protein